MTDAQLPELIKKFVLEHTIMDPFVSTLCGETYFTDLGYPNEQEPQYENSLTPECHLPADATLHSLHPSSYYYRFHHETQDSMHQQMGPQDINNNIYQQEYHSELTQCYPTTVQLQTTLALDGYNTQLTGIKTDPYASAHSGYDDRGVSYRDADIYDSDESVELSSEFCNASSICQSVQIKTEKWTKTRLPAFNDVFTDKGRHSKGSNNRGRPVTYRRPGSNFVDSDDLDSEEDDHMSLCPGSSKVRRGAKNILLWKFLLEELISKKASHVQWVNRREGTFKFVDTAECSKLWGLKKKKDDMNFEKLSRGIRHYYRDGLMSRLDGTRLVYKFNWDRVPKAFRKMANVY